MLKKEEVIFELLLSLNKGNSGYVADRVEYAINQYNKLVETGLIVETIENDIVYTNIPKK